jgi:hypothetical protein
MQRREISLPRNMPFAIDGWGLGWILSNWNGHRVIGHDGGTIGQYSFLRISPTRRVAFALLTNGGNAGALYQDLVDELFGARIGRREPQLTPPEQPPRVDPTRFVGRYENIVQVCTVAERRGELVMTLVPKAAEMGVPVRNAPLAFIDRSAALPRTGNAMIDRLVLHFSPPDDGRSTFVQVGLRQLRRSD